MLDILSAMNMRKPLTKPAVIGGGIKPLHNPALGVVDTDPVGGAGVRDPHSGGLHAGGGGMADRKPGANWGERKEKLASVMGDLGQLFNREPAQPAPMQPGMIAAPNAPMQMPQIQYQQGQGLVDTEEARRRKMMMSEQSY